MPFGPEIPDEDVLRALKDDASAPAPAEARRRVLSRLGVAAAAGAAALSTATLATAASKAAGHSAAPVAGSALGLGLAKLVVAHPVAGIVATLAIGAGTGIVAYEATEPSRAAPAIVTPRASSLPRTAERRAESARPRGEPPSTPPAASPPQPEPARAPIEAAPPAATVRTSSPGQDDERGRSAGLATSLEPSSARGSSLAEQQGLLDQARASLRRGDGANALAVVTRHESLYPLTEFAEERGAIRILALVMTGQDEPARALAESFERRFPNSLFLPSLRRALGREPVNPPSSSP
jgi:hypothetical protein